MQEIFAGRNLCESLTSRQKIFFDFRSLFSQFKVEQFIREDFISQLRGKNRKTAKFFPRKNVSHYNISCSDDYFRITLIFCIYCCRFIFIL